MDLADQMAESIIKEHAKIIGPIAWEEATKTAGLLVDLQSKKVQVVGVAPVVLKELVRHFEVLFGLTARQVSRAAVKSLIDEESKELLPSILK
ncbi:MAG: hypothetical protein U0517_02445 [Candidatus Andersenbacteria bacterium]